MSTRLPVMAVETEMERPPGSLALRHDEVEA